MDGKVVYYRIYDAGGMIDIDKLKFKTSDTLDQLQISIQSSIPPYISIPPLCIIKTPAKIIETSTGKTKIEPLVKVFSIGVISIQISIDFENITFEELNKYCNPKIKIKDNFENIDVIFNEILSEVNKKIKNALYDLYEVSVTHETYTVFCFSKVGDILIKDFLTTNRKKIAGILTLRESEPMLSDKEINDILESYFSYEQNDFVIMDWDSAIIVNPNKKFEDILLVLEISNLMLLELRTYDSYLNQILKDSYKDIDLFYSKKLRYKTAKDTIKDIITTRIDLLRMTDVLTNTTKFIGEWYLAKLYDSCAEKFHLIEWEKNISRKLSTLNELYMVLNNALHDRKMLILEFSIVLLFIVDLLVLVLTLFL